MILGMSLSTFTFVHVLISLIGIGTGMIVLLGLIGGKRLDGWTSIFPNDRCLAPFLRDLSHSRALLQRVRSGRAVLPEDTGTQTTGADTIGAPVRYRAARSASVIHRSGDNGSEKVSRTRTDGNGGARRSLIAAAMIRYSTPFRPTNTRGVSSGFMEAPC
jgi:hypothetical protein